MSGIGQRKSSSYYRMLKLFVLNDERPRLIEPSTLVLGMMEWASVEAVATVDLVVKVPGTEGEAAVLALAAVIGMEGVATDMEEVCY